MEKDGRLALVTVGTTEFDDLIHHIDNEDFLRLLLQMGLNRLVVQRGRGQRSPETLLKASTTLGVQVEVIRFHENLSTVIAQAALVIGHAGAGTILDAVAGHSPIIIVVNDSLQGNHQLELASVVAQKGVGKVTSPSRLLATLSEAYAEDMLRQAGQASFPILESDRFVAVLDEIFNFA
eukprot:gene8543-9416_t